MRLYKNRRAAHPSVAEAQDSCRLGPLEQALNGFHDDLLPHHCFRQSGGLSLGGSHSNQPRPRLRTGHLTVVVASIGRRNASSKYLGRRLPGKGSTRPFVEFLRDLVELASRNSAKIGLLGEVLPEKPVCVLIAATFPGAVGIAEKHLDVGVDRELNVVSHFLSLIPR